MRSWTGQGTLERLVTGDGCEEKGCYALGVWLVSFDGASTHLCSKHTQKWMRDAGRWAEASGIKLKE